MLVSMRTTCGGGVTVATPQILIFLLFFSSTLDMKFAMLESGRSGIYICHQAEFPNLYELESSCMCS
ncbi:Uncharacterized protein TCM_028907 [Theobroma cacao]|uniref:Uncharacterized protein n=1 Tax=Theobroma cacao TaxID=3641 RepID=A0A061GCR1_THECC|nr:Uncharacterized protein TCM_028907 [Theobroma cacao]